MNAEQYVGVLKDELLRNSRDVFPRQNKKISARSSTLQCIEKGKTNFAINFKLHFISVLISALKHSLFYVKSAFEKHGINVLTWPGN